MKRQTLYLRKYDWIVYVFYDTMTEDAHTIINVLKHLGCSKKGIIRSYKNINKGNNNAGLTYSNPRLRESVISLGHASSLAEFLNTWQHEITHLCRHICEYFQIGPFSEEAAYLSGDIAKKMHPMLIGYTCKCGKCKY